MATNKERIESLEVGLGGLHDAVSRLELGVADKFQQLESTLSKISEALVTKTELGSSQGASITNRTRHQKDEGSEGFTGRPMFFSKLAKIEFPKYSGDDPTEWFTRVEQFFEYQETLETQKVSLASFHLEGEANQWWQWLRRAYKEERKEITWDTFVEELWSRFGPTDCEDFDEALSRVKQTNTLRDYQKEFERLGNRVQGWTQKALVGTFMGGLKAEIADGIRMFKPKTLKEAISLARMRDEQVSKQQELSRFTNRPAANITSPVAAKSPSTMKRLTWDEMQNRRAQGLCFNCDDKFTPGHRCRGPQLLIMDGSLEEDSDEDATWESTEQIRARFVNLEDKVALSGGGNDALRK